MSEKHKVPRSVGTHDGAFHADEVTACAVLLLFNLIDRDKIVRTRDPHKLAECDFVCDVGGILDPKLHLFDHHQADYKGNQSSAGLVLSYLMDKEYITPHLYQQFHNTLFKGVDDHDNGQDLQVPGVCTYSHIITNFNPIHNDASPEELDAAFFEALDFAYGHLKRMYERYQYIRECKSIVQAVMVTDKPYLLFDRMIPWMDAFFEMGGVDHPAKFVIMPAGQHWKLRGIPPTLQRKMEVRQPLPQEWAGLLDDDLKKASGNQGAVFCHKGRFISVWETKEDAMAALDYVLALDKEKI